jgi:amyloid beta precursor protein binding protein 1
LEQGSVCLVNATAAGTEALKSLILPGVGKFTVVDNNIVTISDLGENFFVNEEDLGKSRAEAVTNHLLLHAVLLNREESKGIKADPVELLKTKEEFYATYDVIILSGVSLETVTIFNEFAAKNFVSLIVIQSYGQIAILQSYAAVHPIFNNR